MGVLQTFFFFRPMLGLPENVPGYALQGALQVFSDPFWVCPSFLTSHGKGTGQNETIRIWTAGFIPCFLFARVPCWVYRSFDQPENDEEANTSLADFSFWQGEGGTPRKKTEPKECAPVFPGRWGFGALAGSSGSREDQTFPGPLRDTSYVFQNPSESTSCFFQRSDPAKGVVFLLGPPFEHHPTGASLKRPCPFGSPSESRVHSARRFWGVPSRTYTRSPSSALSRPFFCGRVRVLK